MTKIRSFSCGIMLASLMSLSISGCDRDIQNRQEIHDLTSKYAIHGKIIKIVNSGSFKDPGMEWVFKKDDLKDLFSMDAQLSLADSSDSEYFSNRFYKKFQGPASDSNYRLLRGDLNFGTGICKENSCSVYIFESKTKNLVYGAIYSM